MKIKYISLILGLALMSPLCLSFDIGAFAVGQAIGRASNSSSSCKYPDRVNDRGCHHMNNEEKIKILKERVKMIEKKIEELEREVING